MFQHLVVPIDGSAASWASVPIAARMAASVDGKLDVVTVVDRLADVGPAQADLRDGLVRLGELAVEPMAQVLASDSVARAVADHVEVPVRGDGRDEFARARSVGGGAREYRRRAAAPRVRTVGRDRTPCH